MNPILRGALEAKVIENALILSCREGLSASPLALKIELLPLLQLFDGRTSEEELKSKSIELYGTDEVYKRIYQILDDNLFLENLRANDERIKRRSEYHSGTTREAQFAGLIYPEDPKERREYVKGLTNGEKRFDKVNFIVAPHIDYRRGSETYGATFGSLAPQSWKTCILIGTGHQYSQQLYTVSTKNFTMPGHTFYSDQEKIDQLRKNSAHDIFQEEFLHLREHSLELSLPFLELIAPDCKIVPILVGSLYEYLEDGIKPDKSFVQALSRIIDEDTAIIAGVDMAHLGQDFGDQRVVDDMWLKEIESKDREYLECFPDPDKLWDHIAQDMDARRMCGFPTLYTLFELFKLLGEAPSLKLIDYRQAATPNCCVTFAGLVG